MKYHIITYGCQLNKSDSERIASILEEIRCMKASKINEADLIIVNMCSVRQSAVDRVYGLVPKFKKLKKGNIKLKTLLTGCILKSDQKKFKHFFDYILSIKALPYWKDILLKKEKYVYYPDLKKLRIHKKFDANYFKTTPHYSNNFSAYVPIMTGCNNFCSYCVVPYVRGPEICRPAPEIINEIKNLIEKKFKEIWLFGENVDSYKSLINTDLPQISQIPDIRDIRGQISANSRFVNFAKLLKMVNEIPGEFWINFTSSHPKDFSDELIKTIAQSKKVGKYISLPIQSGNDEILKRMNRPYTVAQYKTLVKKIRQLIPDVCLSTDVIVGFPSETRKRFKNTIKLFKEMKFDMAYIAEYSPRPQTAAFKMKDNVPKKEKEKRREVLTKILEKTSVQNSQKYIGKTLDVLIHKTTKKGALVGKTHFYKTARINYAPRRRSKSYIGKIIQAKIIGAIPWGLKGKLV